jgi:hypothetical protein
MSLEKAIDLKKEYRKPFYGSKRFDATCRCHGSCSWCIDNRLFASNKNRFRVEDELQEWLSGKDDLSWEEYQSALNWEVERDLFED